MGDELALRKRGYTLGISLGEGSYAKVKNAYSAQQGRGVAIKIINKKKASHDFLHRFLPRELEILAAMDHSNIVKTFEIFETSEGSVYIVMELGVKGDLLEFIKAHGALPEDLSRKLFCQLSRALKYLHDMDITHRDLKCENLLLDKDFNLKVSDFGFSKRLEYENGQMILSRTFCGSVAYAAPEVLQGIPYDPKLSDVWSTGVVLFIMMCGSMPYNDSNIRKMLKVQKEHRVDFPRSRVVPTACKDLVRSILHPDLDKRIQLCDILEHSWLCGGPNVTEAVKTKLSKICSKNKSKPQNTQEETKTEAKHSLLKNKSKEEPKTSKHDQDEPKSEVKHSKLKNKSKDKPQTSKHDQEEPTTEADHSTLKNRNKEEPQTSKHDQESKTEAEHSTLKNKSKEEPKTSQFGQENICEAEAQSEPGAFQQAQLTGPSNSSSKDSAN